MKAVYASTATVNDFESQSLTVVEQIMKDSKLSRKEAMKLWFNSKTYKEIVRRKLTYISAMRAYYELGLEINGNPDWMEKEFE